MSSVKILVLLFCLGAMINCWQMDLVPCGTDHCIKCDTTDTNCTLCDSGYILDEIGQSCALCSSVINNCNQCSQNVGEPVTCDICAQGLLPTNTGTACLACSAQISHCANCIPRPQKLDILMCNQCQEDYQLTELRTCQQKSSSASTIIIVTAIVGGVVLIGAGFAIYKCMRKKRGVSRLLQDDYQE